MHNRELHTVVYPSRIFQPEDWLRFVQSTIFTKKWEKFGLNDEDLRRLEILIMMAPRKYPVVSGTGGMRKIRVPDPGSGRGKSHAFRVYFAYFEGHGIVFLTTVFGKNERDDLSDSDKSAMTGLIRDIETFLENENTR